MTNWRTVFARLVPRSRAFKLSEGKNTTKLFDGLDGTLEGAKNDIAASVVGDVLPQTTTKLDEWSRVFGATSTQSREWVTAQWASVGAQDPKYMQDVIRRIVPGSYVYEYVDLPSIQFAQCGGDDSQCGGEYTQCSTATGDEYDALIRALSEQQPPIINEVTGPVAVFPWTCGDEDTQCTTTGEAQCTSLVGFTSAPLPYVHTDGTAPYYWFIAGPGGPLDPLLLSAQTIAEIRSTVVKIKPARTRAIIVANTAAELIQDTISSPVVWYDGDFGDIKQDTVGPV